MLMKNVIIVKVPPNGGSCLSGVVVVMAGLLNFCKKTGASRSPVYVAALTDSGCSGNATVVCNLIHSCEWYTLKHKNIEL